MKTSSTTTKIKAKQPNESDSGAEISRAHRMYIIILGSLDYINSSSFFSHFCSSHLASVSLPPLLLLLLHTLALLFLSFEVCVCECVCVLRSISRTSEEVVFIKLIVTNWNPFNLLWNLSISNKIEAEIQTLLCIVLMCMAGRRILVFLTHLLVWKSVSIENRRDEKKSRQFVSVHGCVMCVFACALQMYNKYGTGLVYGTRT